MVTLFSVVINLFIINPRFYAVGGSVFCGVTVGLEKEMPTHSSILASEIPWTEEPSSYSSWGLQRVGYN